LPLAKSLPALSACVEPIMPPKIFSLAALATEMVLIPFYPIPEPGKYPATFIAGTGYLPRIKLL